MECGVGTKIILALPIVYITLVQKAINLKMAHN